MKLTLLTITFVVAPLCTVNGKPAFTTADVLLIRKHASRNSQVLGMIPYGTQVEPDQKIWEGDGLEWMWVPTLNGYLARPYLSETEPPHAAKALDLMSSIGGVVCHGSGHDTSIRIRFANGSFAYIAGPPALGINTFEQGSGTYAVGPGGSITLTVVKLLNTPTWPPTIDIPPRGAPGKSSRRLKIIFAPEFNGFFLEKDLPEGFVFPVNTLKYAQTLDPQSRNGCTFREGDCEKSMYGFVSNRGFLCILTPR